MHRLPVRFTAVGTALLVALAQFACACGLAAAATRPAPRVEVEPAAEHRCCTHRPASPANTPPADRPVDDGSKSEGVPDGEHCPHCAGGVAAAVAAQPGPAAGGVTPPDPVAAATPAAPESAPSVDPSSRSPRLSPPPLLSPPTLLGLCCALNL